MPKQTSSNPLAEVAASVVAADPELRSEVQAMVHDLIKQARRTLGPRGLPADRAALMKAVVPTMLRSIQTADADAADQRMAEAYARMKASMRGDLSVDADPEVA